MTEVPSGKDDLAAVIGWAHRLIREILAPGDTAVDLTAGNGHDTLFLFRAVGPEGRVFAFDIQDAALDATAHRLEEAGGRVCRHGRGASRETLQSTGVHLVAASHSQVDRFPIEAAAVIANLGYLPGGDRLPVTRRETTVEALRKALDLLKPGGRLAVVAYIGHPGGRDEAVGVEELIRGLSPREWSTIRIEPVNRPGAPFLLAAGKRVLPPSSPSGD